MPIEPPSQWTPEVTAAYEPVKTLGKGGFASVVLARSRTGPSTNWAAIKVVGGNGGEGAEGGGANVADEKTVKQQIGYAHREFEILSELNHPNIMKLLQHWEDPASCVVVMALSYAKGPTVHALLLRGGRLSFPFARAVSAQLVDAVSYLHSRAVIHRDIKPDNIVVTGADPATQNEIWDDDNGKSPSSSPVEVNWPDLVAKWHVTLVDFGFARALSPSDMSSTSPGMAATATKAGAVGDSNASSIGSSVGSTSGNQLRRDRSVTRRFTRMMSAVGNRAYSAPEVQHGVVERLDSSEDLSRRSAAAGVGISSSSNNADRSSSSLSSSKRRSLYKPRLSFDVTKTLSTHVSRYGLNADAYSVGNTMLHMLTGARPDQNVNELLAIENSPIVVLCRLLCGSCSSRGESAGTSNEGSRTVKYRRVGDIAPEPLRLIRGLTHPDPDQRTTVRTARLYPYVDDALVGRPDYQTFKTVDYLQCTIKRGGAAGTTTSASQSAGAAAVLPTHPENAGGGDLPSPASKLES